jgi:hypothetical protein
VVGFWLAAAAVVVVVVVVVVVAAAAAAAAAVVADGARPWSAPSSTSGVLKSRFSHPQRVSTLQCDSNPITVYAPAK